MSAGDTMYATEVLEVVQCASCAIKYAIPRKFVSERRDDHKSFYCPNGHSQWFPGKSDAEKLRAELEREKERTAHAREWARQEQSRKQVAQRQAAAARGQVTRIKRKVARGECPCCTKTFADLHAHMAETHPDWTGEAPS